MKREEHEALIRRLEEYSRNNPGGYRMRVGALAALGYAYPILILVVAAALAAGVAYIGITERINGAIIKIELILIATVYVIVRSLWVRFPPPDGVSVSRSQAPELYAMIERVCNALKAPFPDRVLITDEFNASAVQMPRLGVFGWYRNIMTLGLPLMNALSPEELESVVGHEMGHLSENHSRFAGWAYRVERTWENLAEAIGQSGNKISQAIFKPFYTWFSPYFDAYSFVLRRADEYVADSCAASVTAPAIAGSALMRLEIQGRNVGKSYWSDTYQKVAIMPQPPVSPVSNFVRVCRTKPPEADAERWLKAALADRTSYSDTHPSLSDRLNGLGVLKEATVPPAEPSQTAAERFLGGSVAEIAADLDDQWVKNTTPMWLLYHAQAQKQKEELTALEKKSVEAELSDEERRKRARHVATLEGMAVAEPLYREILASNPDDSEANYAIGEMLLDREDDAGIAHIERAMRAEPEAIPSGCRLLYGYLRQAGRSDEAESYRARFLDTSEDLQRAQEERRRFVAQDDIDPHGLTSEQINPIVAKLAERPEIEAAYLVRKRLKLSEPSSRPCFVFGITVSSKWYKPESESYGSDTIAWLAQNAEFPGEVIPFVTNKIDKRIRKSVTQFPGALIYEAK